MAPQRNQNSASGRMYRTTAGRISAGIFGTVGVWVKLKYHRWPIHMTPAMTWAQRKKARHQSALARKSICQSPARLGHHADDDRQHDRQNEAGGDRRPQIV